MHYTKATAVDLIALERQEQVVKHRRTPEVDDSYTDERLLEAAIAVLKEDRALWPASMDERIFHHATEKPTKERLVIGAALIAAEIDRVQRALERVDGHVPSATYPPAGTRAVVSPQLWEIGQSVGMPVSEIEHLQTIVGHAATVLDTRVVDDVEWTTIALVGRPTAQHRVPFRCLRFPKEQPAQAN